MVATFVALIIANSWSCSVASYGPACKSDVEVKDDDTAEGVLRDVRDGNISKEIAAGVYKLADLSNDIMNHYVTRRFDGCFQAIHNLKVYLDNPIPKPVDEPDWYANVLSWAGVGKEFLAVAGAATGQPEVEAVAGPLSVLIETLKAIHESEQNMAKQVQQQAGPQATWKEMLDRWENKENDVKRLWSDGLRDMIGALGKELLKDPTLDWSPLVGLAWKAIKQAPTARAWFNSYYAQIIETTHPVNATDPGHEWWPTQLPSRSSNANYFVQATKNGKNYFQGVIFTPQPDVLVACDAIEVVLKKQNNGCWNPSTPGLQGIKPPAEQTDGIQYATLPPATAREQVGDFKVLVSVTDTAFLQYDCKDISEAKYDAEKVVDKFEGCYSSVQDCCNFVGCEPCQNKFFRKDDKIFLGDKMRTCEDFYLKELDGTPKPAARQTVLDGLKIKGGGIDFCRNGSYIRPEHETSEAKTKYAVAAVQWDAESLCKECKTTSLLNVFIDHTCEKVGASFKIQNTDPSNECEAIEEPGRAEAGPWCFNDNHKPGFADYCWGACHGGCWGNYEEVKGCRTSSGCSFFSSAPLCKKGWQGLAAANQTEQTSDESESEADDACSLMFEPYVQCSGSGDDEECWLSGAEVSGIGSVMTNESSTWISFQLSGLMPFCVNPPEGVENSCSVQIHAATSCESDVGSVLGSDSADTETNPYARHLYYPVRSDATGLIQYQLEPSAAAGHAVVVHDIDGSPLACAVISTSCIGAVTAVTTETPEYTGDPTGTPTTTSTTTLYSPERCRACSTICSPCQHCADSKSGDCKKCWSCHDYDDNDDDDDDDDDDCMALNKDHDWDDDEVQCLSETQDDCRLCWQAQIFI